MFFEYPNLLWLLLLLVPVVAIYIYREAKGRKPYLLVSSVTPWKHRGGELKKWARHIPFILRCVALAAIIVAIAMNTNITSSLPLRFLVTRLKAGMLNTKIV